MDLNDPSLPKQSPLVLSLWWICAGAIIATWWWLGAWAAAAAFVCSSLTNYRWDRAMKEMTVDEFIAARKFNGSN